MLKKIKYYLQEMRPRQWIKNLLIFAPLIFLIQLFDLPALCRTILAFICFCLLASSVYVLNDIFDLKIDRNHPKKKKRPLASNKINSQEAKIIFVILLGIGLIIAGYLGNMFLSIMIFYIIFNLIYSAKIKHFVILDLLAIATMYLIRVYAGALAINGFVSNWLILTLFFTALFIAIAKRRSEIIMNNNKNITTRFVLKNYNLQFLDYLLIITNVAALIFYALYTMIHGGLFVWSIFFVVYAMFRYLWIIFIKGIGEEPEKILLKDKPIFLSILAWGIFIIFILYL